VNKFALGLFIIFIRIYDFGFSLDSASSCAALAASNFLSSSSFSFSLTSAFSSAALAFSSSIFFSSSSPKASSHIL